MRSLSLAYGNSRQAKTWVNKTIGFEELKERLKVTIRTPESAEEYAKMNKAQRDLAKDHGGFVGGVLAQGLGSAVGVVGTYLLLLVILVICCVCVTERSLVAVVKRGGGRAYQYAREDADRRRVRREEKREEKREDLY